MNTQQGGSTPQPDKQLSGEQEAGNNIIRWTVRFAYSGCGKREFFELDFDITSDKDIYLVIKDYVSIQNKGETKSDRIRYWSKRKLKTEEPPF